MPTTLLLALLALLGSALAQTADTPASPATRPAQTADGSLAGAQRTEPLEDGIQQLTLQVEGVGTINYGLSIPYGYAAGRPHALVLVLHPGGKEKDYGTWFMREIVEPAMAHLDPIIVAPDCPGQSWVDPIAERGVMALVRHVLDEYTIDRRRILVTGYSMGGRGTWFLAARHADLFTAAIPMAAPPGDEPLESLATIPTYVIHSRNDEVVPFEPAARKAQELQKLGRVIRFRAIGGVEHSDVDGFLEPLRDAGYWVTEHWSK